MEEFIVAMASVLIVVLLFCTFGFYVVVGGILVTAQDILKVLNDTKLQLEHQLEAQIFIHTLRDYKDEENEKDKHTSHFDENRGRKKQRDKDKRHNKNSSSWGSGYDSEELERQRVEGW